MAKRGARKRNAKTRRPDRPNPGALVPSEASTGPEPSPRLSAGPTSHAAAGSARAPRNPGGAEELRETGSADGRAPGLRPECEVADFSASRAPEASGVRGVGADGASADGGVRLTSGVNAQRRDAEPTDDV